MWLLPLLPMFSSGVLVVTLTLSFTVSEFLIFSENETKVYCPDEILLATDAPCILYNLNGYYDGLKALLFHMIEMGLSTEERQKQIYFVENLADIKAILGE